MRTNAEAISPAMGASPPHRPERGHQRPGPLERLRLPHPADLLGRHGEQGVDPLALVGVGVLDESRVGDVAELSKVEVTNPLMPSG
jgi:hypothetical protein